MSKKRSSQTIKESDRIASSSKRIVHVKFMVLYPGQLLRDAALPDNSDTVSLKSEKDLYHLLETLSETHRSSLGNSDRIDMMFWNQKSLKYYGNVFQKLSDLDEDVGTIDNPLLLTCVDRSVKGLTCALLFL